MPSTASVSSTGNKYIDAVLTGTKWATSSLTFSFPAQSSFYGSGYGNGEPNNHFEAFNPAQQTAVRAILAGYSAVANVSFSEVQETSSQHGTLRYAESNKINTAWGYYPSTSATGGDMWFNNSRGYYDNPVKGNYGYFTIIHETGHALGLKHAHESENGFGTMPADRDSLEYTVMTYRSYIGAPTDYYRNGSSDYPQTLMMYDIAAVQTMYGANYNTNSGNSVYTWSPTTGEMLINGVGQGAPGSNKVFMTVWDGGGTDSYDFSAYTTDLRVSLQPGKWSTTSTQQLANLGNGHYATGNIANALLYQSNPASLIENAIGGSGDDLISGNIAANGFTGGRGNDTIDGLGGADTAIYSGDAGDYSYAQNADGAWTVADLRAGSPDGVDTLLSIQFLQFRNITVDLGPSPAMITGTSGNDVIDATRTVVGQATPCNEIDIIHGKAGNDTINAVGADDRVYGGAGADKLIGGAGADTLNGGGGTDTASYAASGAGVTVSLATGIGLGGDAEGDTLTNIENLTGSNFDDTLEGNAGNNRLVGKAGIDTVSYAHAEPSPTDLGVTVNLSSTKAQNTVAAGKDTLSGFENLTGSQFNDTLRGNSGANVINGLAGNDRLTGAGGNDTFVFKENFGQDTITDFTAGPNSVQHDLIVFDQTIFADFDAVMAATTQVGANSVITADADNAVTLLNVHMSSLHRDDFAFT